MTKSNETKLSMEEQKEKALGILDDSFSIVIQHLNNLTIPSSRARVLVASLDLLEQVKANIVREREENTRLKSASSDSAK